VGVKNGAVRFINRLFLFHGGVLRNYSRYISLHIEEWKERKVWKKWKSGMSRNMEQARDSEFTYGY